MASDELSAAQQLAASEWLMRGFWAVIGVVLTLLTQVLLNKRGQFSYQVSHSQVGMSTDDPVFGSVRVTWNGKEMQDLFVSTLQLTNESLKDFDDVIVRVFTGDSQLLTEKTELADTTRLVEFSPTFMSTIHVPDGKRPTPEQEKLVAKRREYLIPLMNRGQSAHFNYLVAVAAGKQPSVFLEVLHKGVKVRFRPKFNELWGVPQPYAAVAGVIFCLAIYAATIQIVDDVWIASLAMLILGFVAQLPGTVLIKLWRFTRKSLGD
jgi:hypothetical protein